MPITQHCRAAFAGGLLLLGAAQALAAGPGTGTSLIPYKGQLDKDGSPVDGTVQFRLGLFTSGAAGTASCLSSLPGSCGVWADQFDNVPVRGGLFAVIMGSGTVAIPDTVFSNQNNLYVGVAVGNGMGGWAVLNGLQRLVSTGYAVRAERAQDFTVDNTLTVNRIAAGPAPGTMPVRRLNVENGEVRVRASTDNATPDIAQFYANNLTQGVGISYSSVEALGSNANQSLTLRSRGNAEVILDSPASARAIITDENGNVSTYLRSLQRRVYVAHYTGYAPTHSYTPIPVSVLQSYCGDEDGCRITLRMRNWDGGNTSQNAVTFSLQFHWGATFGAGITPWRREEVNGTGNAAIILGGVSGNDGDGGITHVLQNHDCYFTDGAYTQGGGAAGDTLNSGLGLLNYGSVYQATCELIIDD